MHGRQRAACALYAFVAITNKQVAHVHHFAVALHIHFIARMQYFGRIKTFFVKRAQISFVIVVNIRIFRPYVYPPNVRVFLLQFGHNVVA